MLMKEASPLPLDQNAILLDLFCLFYGWDPEWFTLLLPDLLSRTTPISLLTEYTSLLSLYMALSSSSIGHFEGSDPARFTQPGTVYGYLERCA